MVQIMFEHFDVPALYVIPSAVLALYESGRTTGLVVDIGDSVSQVVPIYEGHVIQGRVISCKLAGRQLTRRLSRILTEMDGRFSNLSEHGIVRDMKEKCCRVASAPLIDKWPRPFLRELEFSETMDARLMMESERLYDLPDGTRIDLGDRCFWCAEALFRPVLEGCADDEPGVHEAVFNAIMSCCEEIREDLFDNIVLTGGSTMFPGFAQRMQREIQQLTEKGGLSTATTRVRVVARKDRKCSAWEGGSILASLWSFPGMLITKDEYHNLGPSIVHRKCF